MTLPSAIRKDRDLLVLFGLHFISPYFAFLPFVRWTSFSCPHCDAVFRRDYWPRNVRLGRGERICVGCGKAFDDGSREWPELGFAQKFRFYFPPGIQATTGGLLFCAIFTLIIAPRDVLNSPTALVLVSVFLSPVFVWCLIRLLWVQRSKDRFENEPYAMQRKMETQGTN
jgi:hypothetical protein